MTTLVGCSVSPAALSNGIGAQTQKPLAIVVIGLSLILVVLTRVLQPPLLVLAHQWMERRRTPPGGGEPEAAPSAGETLSPRSRLSARSGRADRFPRDCRAAVLAVPELQPLPHVTPVVHLATRRVGTTFRDVDLIRRRTASTRSAGGRPPRFRRSACQRERVTKTGTPPNGATGGSFPAVITSSWGISARRGSPSWRARNVAPFRPSAS